MEIEKRIQEPQVVDEMEPVSEFGKQVYLVSPNRSANIFYTIDGSMPTRHFDSVRVRDLMSKLRLEDLLDSIFSNTIRK